MRKISNNKSELVFVGLLSGKKYKYAYSSQTTYIVVQVQLPSAKPT